MFFKLFFDKVKSLFSSVFKFGIYCLGFITPRSNKIWVIGNRMGQSYIDNSKYLFEYVSKEEKDIKIIWLTREKKVYDFLKKNNLNVAYAYSPVGFFYSFIAGVAIVSVVKSDVNGHAIAGAKKINLWHATPLKKFPGQPKLSGFKSLINKVFFGYRQEVYDFLITTYDEPNSVLDFSVGLKVPLSNIKITGYPRNDMLFSPSDQTPDILRIIRNVVSFDKVVLYMPTFRDVYFDKGYDLFFSFGWDRLALEEILERNNAVLIIRLHFHSKVDSKFLNDLASSKRIFLMNTNDPLEDNYLLLKNTDLLITDYSSVFFDYLLLDRPIIFAPFDFEFYTTKNCNLGYDYNSVTPGPKVKNWEELNKMVDKELSDAGSDYKVFRKEIRDKFNYFQDDGSSRRVTKEIKKFVGI